MTLSRRSQHLARTAVAAALAAALAAPAAEARIDPPATPAFNPREGNPPVVVLRDDDFDWGAAAIGAGGAGAVVAVISLGAFAGASRRRGSASP